MKTLFFTVVPILILALAACGGGVDEAASGAVIGKIEKSDLGPGKSAGVTFDLSPGKYVLICCRWSAKMGRIRGLENPRDGGWCELLDTG